MLNTIVTIPSDKLGSWHWLDKEHPFQLLSWKYNSRNRLFGYRGVCGETDYHFALISRTDKEIVLQLKNIVTPARKAPPQPDPAVEQRAQQLITLLDKMDMARLLMEYEDSHSSLVEQLRDANAKLDAAERTVNTTLEIGADLTSKVEVLEKELTVRKRLTDSQAALIPKLEARCTQYYSELLAALELGADWKKKYQDRKNLDFGLLYGANPFKGSTCHDEVTFSVPDARKLMEDFKKSFPEVAGLFNTQGATTGRTQCKEPNQANAPKSPTAMLQDGVATHDDGKKSRFKSNGIQYAVTEDEDTQYFWTYEFLVGGVFKLTLHHTLPQRRTFQDKRVDTGRMSSQKPEVQHIPLGHPSLRRADESTDMADALKWAIDFGRAEQAVLGIRHTQPLTLKVPRVDTGVWLWHDKQHPSRIYQIRTMALTGKVTKVVSSLGTMQYTWRVTECADGYILTLESTCTLKS